MRISETKIAGTVVNGTAGDVNWTQFGGTLQSRVAASDNQYVYANLANGQTTMGLKCSDFGHDLPPYASVAGQQVHKEQKASAVASIKDHVIKLILADGTLGSENKAIDAYWDSSDEEVDHGDERDPWGERLLGADLNDSDSGCSIRAKNWAAGSRLPYLDYVEKTVWVDVGPLVGQAVSVGAVRSPGRWRG